MEKIYEIDQVVDYKKILSHSFLVENETYRILLEKVKWEHEKYGAQETFDVEIINSNGWGMFRKSFYGSSEDFDEALSLFDRLVRSSKECAYFPCEDRAD